MLRTPDKRRQPPLKTDLLKSLVKFRPDFPYGKVLLKQLRRHLGNPRTLPTLQRIRDMIFFHPHDKAQGGKTVGFTAPRGDHESIFLSLLVALLFSGLKHNRVLFIDGRFDPQTFLVCSRALTLTRDAVKYLNGCGSFECFSNHDQALSFLTSLGNVESLEVFSNEDVGKLISEMRLQFDYLIFDMPPLLESSETRMLLPRLDLFFLTCTADRTRIADIKKCGELMSEAGATSAGVVLTRQKVPFWAPLFGKETFL
jgi:Mrp family chromosome partitioning ATPase